MSRSSRALVLLFLPLLAVFAAADPKPAPPAIKLKSPLGGQVALIGTTHAVTWAGGSGSSLVNIEYTKDGSTFTALVLGTANDGSEAITIPADPSTTVRIRVTETPGGASSSSTSDLSFVYPAVKLLSPNGGQTWFTGSANAVTWKTGNPTSLVDISYTKDGTTFISLLSGTANDGSETITVPADPSTTVRVRVTETTGGTSSMSASVLTFAAPTITLLSPLGGQSWVAGSTRSVTWMPGVASSLVDIEYTTDGSTFKPLVLGTTNDGSQSITIPVDPSATVRVRVTETTSGSSSISTSFLTFAGIRVTSPNGGETWTIGVPATVTWATAGVPGTVNIRYSTDGTTWSLLAPGTANDGSETITVPSTSSTTVRVRINASAGTPFDTSDANFTISLPVQHISGNAASGAAIVGATITLKDKSGAVVSTTTDSSGGYALDVAGLTDPFLVKVDDTSVDPPVTLFSVGSKEGIVNVTPLTDLIVRLFYSVRSLDADTVFASLGASSDVPTAAEIVLLAGVVKGPVEGWLVEAGLDPNTFDIITTPFTADGTGIDGILDVTTITSPGPGVYTVIIDNLTTTSTTSDVTVDSGAGSVTSETSTTDSSGGTTSTSGGTAIPPASASETALTEVNAMLASLADTVNTKGLLLADTDISPFCTADMLNNGEDLAFFTGRLASDARGLTVVSLLVSKFISYDDVTDPANPILTGNLGSVLTLGGGSQSDEAKGMQFKKVGGVWLIFGNRRLGECDVYVEHRMDEAFEGGTGGFRKSLNLQARAVTGTVVSATAWIDSAGQTNPDSAAWAGTSDNPWPTATTMTVGTSSNIVSYEATPGVPTTVVEDEFFLGAGLYDPILGGLSVPILVYPPPGTIVRIDLTPASGPVQSIYITTGATTTSTFTLTSPTDFDLSSAALGSTLTTTWTPPPGFQIVRQKAGCAVHAGTSLNESFESSIPLATTSTSADFSLPTTLDDGSGPVPVTSVETHVFIEGPGGARISILHMLDQ